MIFLVKKLVNILVRIIILVNKTIYFVGEFTKVVNFY